MIVSYGYRIMIETMSETLLFLLNLSSAIVWKRYVVESNRSGSSYGRRYIVKFFQEGSYLND